MFNDVITSGQKFAARVLRTFVDGPKTAAVVSAALKIVKCGDVSDALRMLCEAGFLAEEGKRNPETGETLRERRYRLMDNYTRFYLKFIKPHKDVIDAGAFEFSRLDEIEGIDAVMGLAFENQVVNNYRELLPLLHMDGALVVSAGCFSPRQTPTRAWKH